MFRVSLSLNTRVPTKSSAGTWSGLDYPDPPPRSVAADAEGIRHAIDVIEPGGDQRDLEDSAVLEADRAQAIVVGAGDLRRVARQLRAVVARNVLPT
jgi:hypothetical protein